MLITISQIHFITDTRGISRGNVVRRDVLCKEFQVNKFRDVVVVIELLIVRKVADASEQELSQRF